MERSVIFGAYFDCAKNKKHLILPRRRDLREQFAEIHNIIILSHINQKSV